MTQIYASVAVGTAATLLAITLLLLRDIQGRRPVLAVAERWMAAQTRTSGVVLIVLFATVLFSFARIPVLERTEAIGASVSPKAASPVQSTANTSEDGISADQALANLRAYTDKLDGNAAAAPATASAAALPDVSTMIDKLIARLEKHPDDVRGWKMLGWSYLNTEKSAEAAKAYEAALKLDPNDAEIKKGLDAAKGMGTTAPAPAAPTVENANAAAAQSGQQQDAIIRGMVDKLAARLESSPNDEVGWLHLMRSRMTLGEKDAARAALTKALATFASDDGAKSRLTAAARELGVETN